MKVFIYPPSTLANSYFIEIDSNGKMDVFVDSAEKNTTPDFHSGNSSISYTKHDSTILNKEQKDKIISLQAEILKEKQYQHDDKTFTSDAWDISIVFEDKTYGDYYGQGYNKNINELIDTLIEYASLPIDLHGFS